MANDIPPGDDTVYLPVVPGVDGNERLRSYRPSSTTSNAFELNDNGTADPNPDQIAKARIEAQYRNDEAARRTGRGSKRGR